MPGHHERRQTGAHQPAERNPCVEVAVREYRRRSVDTLGNEAHHDDDDNRGHADEIRRYRTTNWLLGHRGPLTGLSAVISGSASRGKFFLQQEWAPSTATETFALRGRCTR